MYETILNLQKEMKKWGKTPHGEDRNLSKAPLQWTPQPWGESPDRSCRLAHEDSKGAAEDSEPLESQCFPFGAA